MRITSGLRRIASRTACSPVSASPTTRQPSSSARSRPTIRIARSSSTITVLEIVELLDGPLGRGATGVFAAAADAARKVLAETTIADVVEREARAATTPMYYI